MDQQILRKFEARCTQEESPACQSSCPLHVEARSFVQLMLEGKVQKARQILDRTLPLAGLSAFLCEGICARSCRRSEIDDAVNISMLERACVLNSKTQKPMCMPCSGKKIALAGSGISSLILAFELAKKGHAVCVFYTNEIGEHLKEKNLPENTLANSIELLESMQVKFIEHANFDAQWANSILLEYELLYLGLDDSNVLKAIDKFNLNKQNGSYVSYAYSLVTENEKILAGGFNTDNPFINAISDGKKASGSIERIIQGVSPHIAREKEAPYQTKLYTNLKGIEKNPAGKNIHMASLEDAKLEAKRCINCSCLECVKQCAYLAKYSYPKQMIREMYNNLAVCQGYRLANSMINSCAQCGLCKEICPSHLDLGEYTKCLRKEMVTTERMPPSAHEFALEDMHASNSENVQLVRHQKGESKSAYMFFTGCQLPVSLPQQVLSAYEYMTKHLKGGVGIHFACCSMPSAWAAIDEYRLLYVDRLMTTWQNYGKPTYILACASCSEFFTKYCPEIAHISLVEILEKLPVSENAKAINQKLAIHDPCSARAFPKMHEAVRNFAKLIKQEYTELEYGQEMTRCCGNGGLSANNDEINADAFLEKRIEDLNEQTGKALLLYCAICRERFQKKNQPCLHILELAFAYENNLENSIKTPFMSLFERQDKRIEFRAKLLETCFGEKDTMNQDHGKNDLKLIISQETLDIIAQRRIMNADIQAVLEYAEKNEPLFINEKTGHCLSSYRPRQVTYWVEYMKDDKGNFHIFDAYCHRMVVPGVSGEGADALFQECCTKKQFRINSER